MVLGVTASDLLRINIDEILTGRRGVFGLGVFAFAKSPADAAAILQTNKG